MTDTDSLLYHIKTSDFYKDIENDVDKWFDTSNYKNHPIYTLKNKKVPGLMKDETGGKEIIKFAGLRSKQYSFVMDNGFVEKKDKGIKKSVVKNEIQFSDYVDTLFEDKEMYVNMRIIRSHHHNLYSEHVRKKALCAKDDKRVILEDGISTVPIGYKG